MIDLVKLKDFMNWIRWQYGLSYVDSFIKSLQNKWINFDGGITLKGEKVLNDIKNFKGGL